MDCSGLKNINGELVCKHGFPVYPSCNNEPMREGIYRGVPCISEAMAFRAFPETGTPEKPE